MVAAGSIREVRRKSLSMRSFNFSSVPFLLARLALLSVLLLAFIVAAPAYGGCLGFGHGAGKAARQARRAERQATRQGYSAVSVESSYRATYSSAPSPLPLTYRVYSVPYLGIAGPSCATGQCLAR